MCSGRNRRNHGCIGVLTAEGLAASTRFAAVYSSLIQALAAWHHNPTRGRPSDASGNAPAGRTRNAVVSMPCSRKDGSRESIDRQTNYGVSALLLNA